VTIMVTEVFVLPKFTPVLSNVKTLGDLKIAQKTIQLSIVKTHSIVLSVIKLGIVVRSLILLLQSWMN